MQKTRAAFLAALTLACAFAAAASNAAKADWNRPWKTEDRALVIDAYEFNPIDWKTLTADKRIAGFINKASDGLPPEWKCTGKSGDDALLCKNRWWKYTVTKELYMTRREMAKTLGLKWGAYHLGRPGNPREQADHFVDFAEPADDDLIALDIEDNTSEWMSLSDAEIFANQIFIRTGRYPVLYTNGSTAKWISDYQTTYPLLSRLPLWYARYRDDITGMFPEKTWTSYALWQFSSMHNCSARECPYRVKGAKSDIDVNVSPYDVAGLRAAWPFANLVSRPAERAAPLTLVAQFGEKAGAAVASFADVVARQLAAKTQRKEEPAVVEEPVRDADAPLLAAYGPAAAHPRIDPLKLLTETALAERKARSKPARLIEAKPSARPAAPFKPVEVAALGPLDGLQDEMKSVASIVPEPKAAVPVAPPPARRINAAQTSRIRLWLQAAAAGPKPVPPAVAADIAPSVDVTVRGPRLAAVLREASMIRMSDPRSAHQRIANAFQATR